MNEYEQISWKVRSDGDYGRARLGVYYDECVILTVEERPDGVLRTAAVALDDYELDRFIRKLKKARQQKRRLMEVVDL